MSLIVGLDEPDAADAARTGGKASRLAALAQAAGDAYEVPGGFVVTTAAFDRFVAAVPEGERTAERVGAEPLPEELASALEQAMTAHAEAPLAVRSSCTAEDLGSASFAGLYETFLDVRGVAAVKDAVRRCFASAFAERVRAYRGTSEPPHMAVLVQRLVRPEAAGVAFSADPVQGRRDLALVSAVEGLGEALVSGAASGEEWEVPEGDAAPVRRRSRGLLDAAQARRIAALARRIADREGTPQDIEWALGEDNLLYLLQARPITSLSEEVRWAAPPGAWIRNFRLGEWIGDPVTPLFATWLLPRIEDRLNANLGALFGMTDLGRPSHVIVNGWYFYGLDFLPKGLGPIVRMLAVSLWSLLTKFHQVASLIPPIARLGFTREHARWRDELLPPYRRAVERARERVEEADPAELARIADELGDHAGDQLTSILGVAGYACKAEMPVAQLWNGELRAVDGTFMDVLASERVHAPAAHHVTGLDWAFPTLGELGALEDCAPDPEVLARSRARAAEVLARAREALASRPKVLARFEKALAEARRAHDARVEQTDAFTLGWPVLRRAALRLGEAAAVRGAIPRREDVFFLERSELDRVIAEDVAPSLHATVEERRSLWERRRRLAPPLLLGELSGPMKDAFAQIDALLAHPESDGAALRGMPGSPGRITARVRILRSMDELGRLEKGEILVSPVTTPGWTPAFARAAAVVTDTGSIASHASIVAREYGIPAVVATGCGTSTLHDGQLVTVDGSRGLVLHAA